jgi:hypothetical protein
MWKTLTVTGFAAGLLAGTVLIAAAQMTTYPDLGGGTAAGGAGPGDAADSTSAAEPEQRDSKTGHVTPEPVNRLGAYGTPLVPGGNGVLGAGDVAVGNWAGTNPGVNRNLSGYTYGAASAFGSPSVARGAGPPPGVSR